VRALVVYESMFGATRDVAAAVAEGLGTGMAVDLAEVADAPDAPRDVDLLVVGGPTHVHGMVGRRSRAAAEDQAADELVSSGPLLRDWIAELPKARDRAAAAFDTRIGKAEWLVGSAGHGIGKRLRRHGYRVIGDHESFFVTGDDGALEDGQLHRAREWGARLAETMRTGGAPGA